MVIGGYTILYIGEYCITIRQPGLIISSLISQPLWGLWQVHGVGRGSEDLLYLRAFRFTHLPGKGRSTLLEVSLLRMRMRMRMRKRMRMRVRKRMRMRGDDDDDVDE